MARWPRFAPRGPARASSRDSALLSTLNLHSNVSVTDRSGRIVDVNENLCRISGYGREELLGQPHSIVQSGVHTEEFWSDMWRTLRAGRAWRGEICSRARNGSLYWMDSIIAPMSADELAEEYISIGTDITAAKLTLQRLRSSEAFLESTGRTAGVGGWQMDLPTGLIEWSAHMNRIHETDLDYQPTLEEGLSFYTPESRPAIEQAIADAVQRGVGWDLELQLVTAQGRGMWVRSVGTVECVDDRPVRLLGSMQDITARKETEWSLNYERDLMAALLENVPDQIYFKGADGRFLRVNAGMARRHGLTHPSEAVGKTDADFFPEEHVRRAAAIERQIMQSGEPVLEMEEQTLWPDHPPSWTLTTKMPLYDAAGRIVGIFGLSRDITARKRVEAQLQEASARFAIAADSAGIGVWDFDPAANTLNWDDRMYGIYGIAGESGPTPYSVWIGCLHPDDQQSCEAEVAAALRGEREFDTEFRIVRPDGEIRYLKASARTLRSADGSAVRMTGVNFDVTERRRAELRLLETSSLLRTVLDSASETSVIATDPNMVIKVFNAGAARLLGYTDEEVIDRRTLAGMHDPEELRARAVELGARVDRPLEASTVLIEPSTLDHARDWSYVRKDGTHVTVSLVVSAMHTLTGELIGYIGVAHDVTRQKQYEESLRDTMQKAENANRAKSQFLANMSHEIRTPMNAVIGLSYLLAETRLEAEQRELLSKIQVSSKSLLAILNDVLDLTKIEAGELIVECAPFSPYSLLRGISDVMAVQAHAKGIDFEVDLADDLPIALKGDATRLSQILTNLLSNAVKFTDHGRVTLRVARIDGKDAGSNKLCFVVQDTGIGISPEAQAHLFAPFSQADASITRRYGGTGLGLSIVKSLSKLLGGDVALKSTPGVGSEFTVVLEFTAAPPELLSAQAHPDTPGHHALAGVRVLLVDDSDINLDVTRRVLELHGAKVQVANNGQEAVDCLREKPYDFDVVLMDVQMPLLDGYQATILIRAELGLVDLPIIALTAGALSSERQRAAAAGMDDFITKPFDAPTLTTIVQRHVRISALQASTPTEELSKPPPPETVPWPEIAGIDSTDARVRLCDDLGLFRSNLKRLLDEFRDVAMPDASNSDAMPAYAARLHKLSGSAGTLGANAVRQLAVDARAACVAREFKLAERLAGALGEQMAHLRRSAEPVLEEARNQTELAASKPLPSDVSLQPQHLVDLIQSLRQQSLSALYRFHAISPQLRPHLGKEPFDVIRDHVENLRFMEAAKALEDSRPLASGSA
jgi:PAS domain S-box-containing protein